MHPLYIFLQVVVQIIENTIIYTTVGEHEQNSNSCNQNI